MSIVEKIRHNLDDMTRSERQVASYCLGRLSDTAFYTLDKMALEAQTSTTSVLRFCRRLGFVGFRDFQEAVRAELKYHPGLPSKYQRIIGQDISDSLLAQTIQQGTDCIRKSFQELPYERICQAVNLIAGARRVFTCGMRESYAMACYALTRFQTVRANVYPLEVGTQGNWESILSLGKEDVCVFYLFHRYTAQSLQLLKLLKQQGVQVILVTSPPCDTVAKYAAVLLPCHVDIGGIKNSYLAPVCLADYLCSAVAAAGGQAALEHMKQSEALFREFGILAD